MTFHYREVDVEKREPLIARAKQLIKDAGYKVEELCFNFSIAFFGSFIQSSIEIQYKNIKIAKKSLRSYSYLRSLWNN
jgi:hypothetical protein